MSIGRLVRMHDLCADLLCLSARGYDESHFCYPDPTCSVALVRIISGASIRTYNTPNNNNFRNKVHAHVTMQLQAEQSKEVLTIKVLTIKVLTIKVLTIKVLINRVFQSICHSRLATSLVVKETTSQAIL
ncbi:hypothetical protein KCU67_g89, partial [Aureobasidium melanogenum]